MIHPGDRPGSDRFCLMADGVRDWAGFVEDVAAARPIAGDHGALCNLIPSRYHFAVSLTACLCDDVPLLMPPSRAANTVAAVLTGWERPGVLSQGWQPAGSGVPVDVGNLPDAPGQIFMFTSGSTGQPVRHRKTWGILAGGAVLTTEILERAGLSRDDTVIAGTTPHQHMYGMEAAIFAGLSGGYCLYDETVFYPEDLRVLCARARDAGIGAVALVTSPAHLHHVAPMIRDCPEVRCVISATAPLHPSMAAGIEADGRCNVFEIYGSTETGSLAWRRPTEDEAWTPLDGFSLDQRPDGWYADAPHLDGAVVLNDLLEAGPDGRFRLVGRTEDIVQIAGKRENLGALNAALLSMPEIADGHVLRQRLPDTDRLAVLVVPRHNGHSGDQADLRARVRKHLLRHLDPVFVPKRIHLVEELPRNATGKLPADVLEHLHRRFFDGPAT